MFPFIINTHGIIIPTFFFMIMVASLVATLHIYYQAPKHALSQIVVLDISFFATLSGVIGARLFHIFVEAPAYYWEQPIRVFYFWQGGFVGYGAFLGILFSTLVYLKIKKQPVLRYVDLVALGCPWIIFLIRVGCVGAGCCYGKPTDFFFHLTFTDSASDAGHDFPGVHLHATQIYDMLNAIITFCIIHWIDRRKKFQGQVLIVFFMSYAVMRFMIEFLRGDADRGLYLNNTISTSQITGIVIVVVASFFYQICKRKYPVTT